MSMGFEMCCDRAKSWAAKMPFVKRLWVFGSQAKRTNRPDSDLDVAIELSPAALGEDDPHTYWHFESPAMAASLQREIPITVDLQLYISGTKDKVPSFVEDHGILLYEKDDE